MRYSYKTKFLGAVDGDTVKIMIDHGLNIFSTQILRLARINTPELKSSDEAIRIKAIEAKTKVQKFCETAHEVTVEIVGKDTYGRWISEVFIDKINLSDWVLQNQLGAPYPKNDPRG